MSGCAVGSDGKLLDAKDIRWFEDADSSEPINHATTTASITTTPNSSTTTHLFFRDGPAPTAEVIAAQHSGRATRPSLRITDSDNAEGAYASRHKRKASQGIAAPGRHINHKVADDNKESSDSSEISDYEPNVAEAVILPAESSDIEVGDMEPEDDSDTGFTATKAMGDVDR